MSKISHELVFIAGLHRLDAANKKAVFYLMNTSRNRNRWGVTQKALDEALPSLLKKPLGMGKDYTLFARIDGIVKYETKGGDKKQVSVHAQPL